MLNGLCILTDLVSPSDPHGIGPTLLVISSHFINEEKIKSGKVYESCLRLHVHRMKHLDSNLFAGLQSFALTQYAK